MLKNFFVVFLFLLIGFFSGFKFQSLIKNKVIARPDVPTAAVFPGNTEVAQYYYDTQAKINFSFTEGWEVINEKHLPGNTADIADLLILGPYAYTGDKYLHRYPGRVIIQVSTSDNNKDALSLEKNVPVDVGSVIDPTPITLGDTPAFKYDFYNKEYKVHRIEVIAKKGNLLYEISYYGPSASDLSVFQNNSILEKQALDLLNSIEIK